MGVRVLCMHKAVLSFFLVCFSFACFACASESESPYERKERLSAELGPEYVHSYSVAEDRDLKERCGWSDDCLSMVRAAMTPPDGAWRKCSYEDIKSWIEQKIHTTNFWLFIESNCGRISGTIR